MGEAYTDWTKAYGFLRSLRGRDHLSLESTAETIYDQVTPGFVNLAKRARYYALYCWILHDYVDGGYREREDFEPFFRRREHAYALACLSHEHRPGMPGEFGIMGTQNAKRFWKAGEATLDLSRSHMKSSLGGYGLYYRNAMQRVGLIQLSEGRPKLTEAAPGKPSGRALAEAFEGVVGGTEYFRRYRDDYHVPREVLEEYGRAACVCEMAEAADGEVLRRALLQPDPPERDAATRRVHLARTKTLGLVFDALARSSGERMDDPAWRDLQFYGRFSDGRPYDPPERLADAALVWRMYQQRELLVYALTGLWAELLSWLEERRSGTLEEWIEEVDAVADLLGTGGRFGLLPEHGRPSEVAVSDLLDAVARAANRPAFGPELAGEVRRSVGKDAACSEKAIYGSLHRRELAERGERVAGSLWLLLVLYARTRDWASDGPAATSLARIGDARHWSVASVFGEVEARSRGSALDFLAWVFQNLVRQHLTVAMSKLPLDTFMLLYEDGALHYRAPDKAQPTADRYDTILTISRDLGWVRESGGTYALTERGERGRADAQEALP